MLNLSRPDWRKRIRAGNLLPDVAPVDAGLAARAVAYFDALRIPDVLGTPLLRDACGDWFRDIVAMLFGSLDPETKTRLIREVFLLVPKKNGKTTMGAALMLVAVLLNERPNAEFLIVAPTKDIAGLAFRQASGMVNLNRNLRKRFKLQAHIKTLTYLPTGATLCIKAFDANVMTGVKPAGVLVDEEHQIAIKPEAEDVMIQIRGGMISQEEAFLTSYRLACLIWRRGPVGSAIFTDPSLGILKPMDRPPRAPSLTRSYSSFPASVLVPEILPLTCRPLLSSATSFHTPAGTPSPQHQAGNHGRPEFHAGHV